jgi:Importin-beta N-terminal domain
MSSTDVEQVGKLFTAALSNDSSQRQRAEAVIDEISRKENFTSCLIGVMQLPEAEDSSKWLAAVQLKNMINKKWALSRVGKPTTQAYTDREKQQLRSEVLQVIGLKDSKAALQVALAVAKMARHDYPTAWPTLLDELLSPVANGAASGLAVRRIWLALHHVVKQLATKRLPADKRNFQTMSKTLMPFVWSAWMAHSNAIREQLPAALDKRRPPPPLAHHLEAWMVTTKILRRLIMNGLPRSVPVGRL